MGCQSQNGLHTSSTPDARLRDSLIGDNKSVGNNKRTRKEERNGKHNQELHKAQGLGSFGTSKEGIRGSHLRAQTPGHLAQDSERKGEIMGAVALLTLYNKKMERASNVGKLNATFLLAPSARNFDMLRAEMEEYQDAQTDIDELEAHERETIHEYAKQRARYHTGEIDVNKSI